MSSTREVPAALRGAAVTLVGMEALALVVVAGIYAVRAFDGATGAEALAALAGVMGVALAAAAVSLARGRGWPRGLIVTWQILQIAAGVTLMSWSPVAGGMVIAVAVAAGLCVIADARASAAPKSPPEGA